MHSLDVSFPASWLTEWDKTFILGLWTAIQYERDLQPRSHSQAELCWFGSVWFSTVYKCSVNGTQSCQAVPAQFRLILPCQHSLVWFHLVLMCSEDEAMKNLPRIAPVASESVLTHLLCLVTPHSLCNDSAKEVWHAWLTLASMDWKGWVWNCASVNILAHPPQRALPCFRKCGKLRMALNYCKKVS